MEFFRRVRRDEIDKEREVEEFLDRKASEFEVRSKRVQMAESVDSDVTATASSTVSDIRAKLPVLVKPKKKEKRIVVVKRRLSPSL